MGSDGVAFLQWALPRLGLRWRGFRRVRHQVLRRVRRRFEALGLSSFDAYRRYLGAHPAEWRRLEPLLRVTISRFYRDRGLFDALRESILPALAEAAHPVRVWSAGCASGEEPYSVVLAAAHAAPAVEVEVVGTDIDPVVLERARRARYPRASTRELPEHWVREAFQPRSEEELELDPNLRAQVHFERRDLRRDAPPPGPFDLVLCRNLAFTYFDEASQREALNTFASVMRPGGALVVGSHEPIPEDPRFVPGRRSVYWLCRSC